MSRTTNRTTTRGSTRASNRVSTVEEYLAGFAGAHAARLRELRALCLAAAPEAEETLKWGSPAYVDDTILFQFVGYTSHANVAVTPSTREAFEGEFGDYETGKGTLKIPYAAPLPTELVRRMLDYRVREFAERGVRWM